MCTRDLALSAADCSPYHLDVDLVVPGLQSAHLEPSHISPTQTASPTLSENRHLGNLPSAVDTSPAPAPSSSSVSRMKDSLEALIVGFAPKKKRRSISDGAMAGLVPAVDEFQKALYKCIYIWPSLKTGATTNQVKSQRIP